jgi:hypothetical protein
MMLGSRFASVKGKRISANGWKDADAQTAQAASSRTGRWAITIALWTISNKFDEV